MKKVLLSFVFVLGFISLFYVFDCTYIHAESADEVLRERELERIQKQVADIQLVIPDITSEPSPTITFVPIEGDTIELRINDGEYKEIESPYQFSGLSIGKYVLDFRYVDASGINQTFSKNLIIIPREARMQNQKLLFKEDEKVEISGTALPYAEVSLWIISSEEFILKSATVNKEGNWEIDITESVECGDYKIVTMVKKDGFSSNTSTPLNISYCIEGGVSIIDGIDDEEGKTVSEWGSAIIKRIKENDSSVLIGLTTLIFGLLLGLIYSFISVGRVKKKFGKLLNSRLTFDKVDSVEDKTEKKQKEAPPESKSRSIWKLKKKKATKEVTKEDIDDEEIVKSEVGEADVDVEEVDSEEIVVLDKENLDKETVIDTIDEDDEEEISEDIVKTEIDEEVTDKKEKKISNDKKSKKKKKNTKKKKKAIKKDSQNKMFSRDEFLSKFQELEKKKKGPKITLTSESIPDISDDTD